MKTILIPSLLAACVALSATSALAYAGAPSRSIAAETSIVHKAQGKHHGARRGCRFSHGRLICGGRQGRDHGRSNRGHGGRKHGGGRH